MEGMFLRKAALVSSAAGVSLAVLAAIAFGLLRLEDPGTITLASQIQEDDALLFLHTKDRATFMRVLGNVAKKMQEVPTGNVYELAVTGSGTNIRWAISIQNETAPPSLILSETAPYLEGKARTSLAHSQLLKTYVGSQGKEFLWARPEFLPAGNGITGSLTKAVFDGTSSFLLLWNDDGHGQLIAKGQRRHSYLPVSALHADDARVLLQSGDGSWLRDIAAHIRETDAALAAGLEGILRQLLLVRTGGSDVTEFSQDLLLGPTSLVMTDTAMMLAGTARTEAVTMEWLRRFASVHSVGTERDITFPKKETRNDIVAGSGGTTEVLERVGNWSLLRAGDEADGIVAAVLGRSFILGTEELSLKSLVANDRKAADEPAFRGSIDVPWLFGWLHTHASKLTSGVQKDVETLLGSDIGRIEWTSRPVTAGWRTDFVLTRTSQNQGTLAK